MRGGISDGMRGGIRDEQTRSGTCVGSELESRVEQVWDKARADQGGWRPGTCQTRCGPPDRGASSCPLHHTKGLHASGRPPCARCASIKVSHIVWRSVMCQVRINPGFSSHLAVRHVQGEHQFSLIIEGLHASSCLSCVRSASAPRPCVSELSLLTYSPTVIPSNL